VLGYYIFSNAPIDRQLTEPYIHNQPIELHVTSSSITCTLYDITHLHMQALVKF